MRTLTSIIVLALLNHSALAASSEISITTKGNDKLTLQGVAEVEVPENCFSDKTKVSLHQDAIKKGLDDSAAQALAAERAPYEVRINTGKLAPSCTLKIKMNVPNEFSKKTLAKNSEVALFSKTMVQDGAESFEQTSPVTADFDSKKDLLAGSVVPSLFSNKKTGNGTYEAVFLISQDEKFTPPAEDILPLPKKETTTAAYVIANAQFDRQDFKVADPADENRKDLPVFFHRIKEGKGTVIALRMFDPGDTYAIDDEHFEKTTIWMDEFKPGTYTFGKDNLTAYYTRGGSAWVKGQCGYVPDNGTLTIAEEKDGTLITLSTKVKCKPEEITVNISATAKKITPKQITPWIGKKGDHPYDETYLKPGAARP